MANNDEVKIKIKIDSNFNELTALNSEVKTR